MFIASIFFVKLQKSGKCALYRISLNKGSQIGRDMCNICARVLPPVEIQIRLP